MTGETLFCHVLPFRHDLTCVHRSECSRWVTGVQGCVFNKVRSWTEAMSLYNGRLAKGACEVLN